MDDRLVLLSVWSNQWLADTCHIFVSFIYWLTKKPLFHWTPSVWFDTDLLSSTSSQLKPNLSSRGTLKVPKNEAVILKIGPWFTRYLVKILYQRATALLNWNWSFGIFRPFSNLYSKNLGSIHFHFSESFYIYSLYVQIRIAFSQEKMHLTYGLTTFS